MAKEKLTPETTDEIQETDAVEIQTEDREPVAPRTQTVVKKSGTGLSLLAILIALGVGGAGYYFGQQQVDEFQQKLTALEAQINNKTVESRFKKLGSADFCKVYKIEIINFRNKKHNTPHKAITTPLRKLSGDMLCSEILKTEFQSIYRLIINAKNEINTVTPPIKM
mgnify:CR=1 FL=1